MGGAHRFSKSNFLGTVGDRNQHDVDDADGAQGKRHEPHASQESVHGIEDFANPVDSADGIPLVEGILGGVGKSMIAGNDSVDLELSHFVKSPSSWLIKDHID